MRHRKRVVLVAAITAAVLTGTGLALAFGTFAAKVDYEADASPRDIAVGKLDDNRRLDLAVVDSSTASTVSILMGKANGTFVPEDDAIIPGAGGSPLGIVGADFDADGRRDLAVAIPQDHGVAILGGRGDGTFDLALQSSTGEEPHGLAVADFNRDRRPDLAVGTEFSPDVAVDEVVVLRGKGDLTFRAPVGYEVEDNPQEVVSGRFDADRHRDLAVLNGTPDVSVLRGKADGTFRDAVTYTAADDGQGESGQGLEAGDLDRDGDLDLAVAIGDSKVAILDGEGDATFADPVHLTVGAFPSSLTLAQLTEDRKLDIATTNEGDDDISVLVNEGGGSFADPVDYPTLDIPRAIEAGDFDRDGGMDLAVSNGGDDAVSVLLNQP